MMLVTTLNCGNLMLETRLELEWFEHIGDIMEILEAAKDNYAK